MGKDVMWSSLAWPGLEHVLWTEDGGLQADSQAVHALPDGPVRVSYRLAADPAGHIRHFSIEVIGAVATHRLVLSGDGNGIWADGDGQPVPGLSGCLDVDVSCTPLTNTLPIRRLGLTPGASVEFLVAYVQVPQLETRAVAQRYTHLGPDRSVTTYGYRSGSFHADITVDQHGLVCDYPGLWRRTDVGNNE